MKLTNEQIEVAVNWWADRVCRPEFHTQSPGEHDQSVAMAEMMASMLTKPVNENNKDKFMGALRKNLLSDEYNLHWGLHVDYHPDKLLFDAAKKAEIDEHNFPWKTSMYFDENGGVKAKIGYGSPLETLLEGATEND